LKFKVCANLPNAPSPNLEKRDEVTFIDCTACNIKRLKAIYTLLLEDLVIMFGKMMQRLDGKRRGVK
jgi:hypothetical protein